MDWIVRNSVKKDKIIVEFQQYLSEYVEDNYYTSNNNWHFRKGNYDMELRLSENQNSKRHIICPICYKLSDFKAEHGDGYLCGECQSFIRAYGNVMYIWNTNNYNILKEQRKEKLKQLFNI